MLKPVHHDILVVRKVQKIIYVSMFRVNGREHAVQHCGAGNITNLVSGLVCTKAAKTIAR